MQFVFGFLQLFAQLGQLPGEAQQPLALRLVGLGTFFFVRIGLFAFLEHVAQIGLAGLDPLTNMDRDGRA